MWSRYLIATYGLQRHIEFREENFNVGKNRRADYIFCCLPADLSREQH